MSRGRIVMGIAVVLVFGGWYAFRPERLFVDKTVNESFEIAGGSAASEAVSGEMLSGIFHGVAHETRGLATIYQLPGGKRVLRLTDFETSNGPDVQVYLGMAPDADDNETVTEAGFVGLGSLKGTTGDQNYDLPEDLDLSQYRSVTIWCRRFGVNFATAPLAPRAS